MRVRHQQILSNTAVIGRTQWSDKDQLKRVIFTVPQADHTLRHREKMERIAQARIEDSAVDRCIFSVRVGTNTYRVYYLATFSLDLDRPSKIWPCFEIEFDDGAMLSDYLDSVQHVVSFLALVLTKDLKPEAIQILRLTQLEFESAIKKDEFVEAHSVEYIWSIKEHDASGIWTGQDFLRVWDDTYLAVFEACLSAWITRYKLWRPANVLMLGCLRRWGEMSPERLLAACTWFEEIPTSKSLNTMDSKDFERIALSANEKAVELGYSEMDNRITGALKRLSGESHKDQFERLLKGIREKFGYQITSDDIIAHLLQAMKLRGKAAHGHLSVEDDGEYRKLAKSTYAMEAFCFLLTVQDLPIDKKAIEQLGGNMFLQNYRLSY
jgi:ApeA N-terminal domain 1